MERKEHFAATEQKETSDLFCGVVAKDPYDYGNIVAYTHRVLGYPLRMIQASDERLKGQYLALFTDTSASSAKMLGLTKLFAQQAIAQTLFQISLGQWRELLEWGVSAHAARRTYQRPETDGDDAAEALALRGLRTCLERAQANLRTQGKEIAPRSATVLARLHGRTAQRVDVFTPEDLAGLAMPTLRRLLTDYPSLRPSKSTRC